MKKVVSLKFRPQSHLSLDQWAIHKIVALAMQQVESIEVNAVSAAPGLLKHIEVRRAFRV
jgi:hypothetical protein